MLQVDGAQTGLGQRVVGQREALEAGGHGLVVHRFGQAHVDVLGLAGLHAVTARGAHRHRLPTLGQWHRVRGSMDRNRGHRRSGRRCCRGVRPAPIPPRQDQARLVHQHRHCHTDRPVRRVHRLFGHHVHTIVSICDAPPPAPRPRRSASTPAACPPSATTPPSRATRPSGPSPTSGCPSRRPPRSPSRLMPTRKPLLRLISAPSRRLRPISAPSRRPKADWSGCAGGWPNRRTRWAAACSACSAAATSTRTPGRRSRTPCWSPTWARSSPTRW